MKKYIMVLVYLVLVLFVVSCVQPSNIKTNKSMGTIQKIQFNKGISISDGIMTILYTSVSYPEDSWVIERAVLDNNITHIDLHLNNPGGNPFVMMDFVSTLELLQKKGITIITYARGVIASAAVPIFIMGDKRIIYPRSWVMIHPGGWKGNEWRFSPSMLELFETLELEYAMLIADRSNIPFTDLLKMLNCGGTEKDENGKLLDSQTGQHWFSAKKALSLGIATEIAKEII